MLNDLLIKLWIIFFVNNQNVTNYVRRFKMTMQNIRRMIINVSINDNFFILYFHLNFNAKFEQYREHYAQIHEIVSNKLNSIKKINYAINRFLNICVNRLILKKSTFVMIVITFVSNSFFDKIQLNAQSKIKNVVIIIVKMCIIAKQNIIQRASIVNSSISNEIVINSTKNEMIETTNANEKTTTTTTKDSIRRSMTKKKSTRFTSLSISRFWRSWALCFVKSRIKFWTRSAFNTTYETNRRSFFTRRFRNSFLSTI
jgi:hypothetical protein